MYEAILYTKSLDETLWAEIANTVVHLKNQSLKTELHS